MTTSRIPALRVRVVADHPPRPDGEHVLYWMTAARRASHSFALDRAVEWCRELRRPLLVLEALSCDHQWASARFHRFVLDGMRDTAATLARAGIAYHPYVEPQPGAARGLLEALAARACVVIADDSPAFFLPRLLAAGAARVRVRMEAVDGGGILPLDAADHDFPTAYAFRRFLQRALPAHLGVAPSPRPPTRAVAGGAQVPRDVGRRWPAASPTLLAGDDSQLARLPIDHAVAPVASRGGATAARAALREFVARRLPRYLDRSHPDADVASGLSPWLHFGHLSAHEVLGAVLAAEGWDGLPARARPSGQREGWWGLGAAAEAFLDQLVTWRELGANLLRFRPRADRWESLPAWARATLDRHAGDPRPALYDLATLESGTTGDPLWNAAQHELVTTGRLQNYLRMLWGKRILEWTPTPARALEVMLALNDRWALDGRDPNSVSGITWVLGRFDRPWAPERPIFGRVRYMSSAATARKLRLKQYLARHGTPGTPA